MTPGFDRTGGVFVKRQRLDMTLRLLDELGTELARGVAAGDHVDQAIIDFRTASGGTYHVEVSGDTRDYSLLVTRDASFDFDDGPLDIVGQNIGNTGVVVGGFATEVDDGVTRGLNDGFYIAELVDAGGFIWDIQGSGDVWRGSSNAFDFGGMTNWDAFFFNSAGSEENGREFVFGTSAFGNIELVRKIYVPSDGAFARALDIYTNVGVAPIEHTFRVQSDQRNITSRITSSGDDAFTTADEWIVTTQADNRPAVGVVTAGVGAQHPSFVASGNEIRHDY
ncbi:MAG: hypothetical protein GTO04_12310, partial [Planctomycetales bacterium]|nr:hypothetical protein [Planctomycetales bacterium]